MTKLDMFVDYCLHMGYSHEAMTAAARAIGVKAPSNEKWVYYMYFVKYSVVHED